MRRKYPNEIGRVQGPTTETVSNNDGDVDNNIQNRTGWKRKWKWRKAEHNRCGTVRRTIPLSIFLASISVLVSISSLRTATTILTLTSPSTWTLNGNASTSPAPPPFLLPRVRIVLLDGDSPYTPTLLPNQFAPDLLRSISSRRRYTRRLLIPHDPPLVASSSGIDTNNTSSVISLHTKPPPLPVIPPHCQLQIQPQPTCNLLHELSLPVLTASNQLRYQTKGSSRTLWSVHTHDGDVTTEEEEDDDVEKVLALKTARIDNQHDNDIANTFSPHRYHSSTMDYASLSSLSFTLTPGTNPAHHPPIPAVYGTCALSSLHTFLPAGDANQVLHSHKTKQPQWLQHLSLRERNRALLQMAQQAAKAVASLRRGRYVRVWKGVAQVTNVDIIHRDIGPSNVLVHLSRDGNRLVPSVVLDDFDKAYLLLRRVDANGQETCTFRDGLLCGEDGRRVDTRAPEECIPNSDLSHKIDAHGLGTLLFFFLTGERAYSLNTDMPLYHETHSHATFSSSSLKRNRDNGESHSKSNTISNSDSSVEILPKEYTDWWFRNKVKLGGAMPYVPPEMIGDSCILRGIHDAMVGAMASDPLLRWSADDVVLFLDQLQLKCHD